MSDKHAAPTDKTEAKTRRKWSKRDKILTGVIAFIALCIVVGAISANSQPNAQNTSSDSSGSNSNGTIPVGNGSPGDTNTQPQTPSCTSYQILDDQTWLEIVKDPDSYANQCYTVYGEVTQFDSATGTAAFRADVGGTEQTPSYGFVDYPTNTYLTGSTDTLKSVVNNDLFTANVMVVGSYTYTTSLNGQMTVPQLQVDSITVTGTASD